MAHKQSKETAFMLFQNYVHTSSNCIHDSLANWWSQPWPGPLALLALGIWSAGPPWLSTLSVTFVVVQLISWPSTTAWSQWLTDKFCYCVCTVFSFNIPLYWASPPCTGLYSPCQRLCRQRLLIFLWNSVIDPWKKLLLPLSGCVCAANLLASSVNVRQKNLWSRLLFCTPRFIFLSFSSVNAIKCILHELPWLIVVQDRLICFRLAIAVLSHHCFFHQNICWLLTTP